MSVIRIVESGEACHEECITDFPCDICNRVSARGTAILKMHGTQEFKKVESMVIPRVREKRFVTKRKIYKK